MTKFLSTAAALTVASLSLAGGGGQTVSSPYRPAGGNVSIYGLQDITASNPFGSAASVALNFEFNPSIGVAYTDTKGKVVDWGLGVYQKDKNSGFVSTGLSVNYDSLVRASTADLTLMDFDIKDKSGGFRAKKVTPLISLFGANDQLIGTATSDQILRTMTAANTGFKEDSWNLNLGSLLSNMGKSDTAISKVLLFADANSQQGKKSDPYTLMSVGKAQPVPEPASMLAMALGCGLFIRRRNKKS